MTCRDCIHYDVCEEKDTEYTGLPFSIANDKPCEFFKDKSRFIELPCKVGDMIYVIKNNKISAKDIVYYNKIHSRVSEQNEEYWHCVDKDRISINVITFYPENIGKTVFLTKEEAEAKLKELNKKNDSKGSKETA